MAQIYIENKAYAVADGQNLLQACLSLGFDLPYFCWHPALHSVGACRQCAVKLYKDENDTTGKIIMSCMTAVKDAMRISINDPDAKKFRAGIIELLMTNHPHDCPVCDEGGECHLQDMTVMTGHSQRRFAYQKRTHHNQNLGPLIHHEMNRCIACYRCVRFYHTHTGCKDLQVLGAHNHVYFGTAFDGPLESELSGNLVEICPTGVFTDKTFSTHFTRKWDLMCAPSVCVHCSLGCNTIVSERYGTVRCIKNRFNPEVNGYFLCDRGRFGYEFVNDAKRVKLPVLTDSSSLGTIDRARALELVLKCIASASGIVAGIGSPRASLEANFCLSTLVGPDNFYSGHTPQQSAMISCIVDTMTKNSHAVASLADVRNSDAFLVLGLDSTNEAPMLAHAIRMGVMHKKVECAEKYGIPVWDDTALTNANQGQKHDLFIATTHGTKLDSLAAGVYRYDPFDIAALGFTISTFLSPEAPKIGQVSESMRSIAGQIAESLQKARSPVIMAGCLSLEILKAALQIAATVGNHCKLFFSLPSCNSMGLELLKPKSLDLLLEKQTGNTLNQSTLIIVEQDLSLILSQQELDTLAKLYKRWIVIDHTVTATVKASYLCLPAATFAESNGTFVNCEGRAQRFYKACVPGGAIQESWRWLANILEASNKEQWEHFDDILIALSEQHELLKQVSAVSPSAEFRIHERQIPRQSVRGSGRTALLSTAFTASVLKDEESPLSFSMEGYHAASIPASLVNRYWKPGWNSVSALNEFPSSNQQKWNTTQNWGIRLFALPKASTTTFFALPDLKKPLPAEDTAGGYILVALPFVFGSEELSKLCGGISSLIKIPRIFIGQSDASFLQVSNNDLVRVSSSTVSIRLPVEIVEQSAPKVLGIPYGMTAFTKPYAMVTVTKEFTNE